MILFSRAEPTPKRALVSVEQNKPGFGDAGFHAMWSRLMDIAQRRFGSIRASNVLSPST
jgi:hypothetical protein